MKIYCMSDIHACLESFEAALENVICHLDEDDTMLLLLGDYVHGGDSGRGVLDKIMHLQEQYGNDKVMALMGIRCMEACNGMIMKMQMIYT